MPRNKLTDLNNHLFEQLERLNDEEKQGDALQEEIARSKAISQLATTIIDNANLGLQAEKLKIDYGRNDLELPSMLEKNDKA